MFNYVYGVEFDGNALYDPHGDFTNHNVLHWKHSLVEAAQHCGSSVDEVAATLDQSKAKLFAIWEKRAHPHLDNKIITSWNGMMVDAMARGWAGIFFDSAEDPTLVVRLYADYDGAEPVANSVALMNSLVLGALTGRKQLLSMADQIMECFSERMQTFPIAFPLLQ